MTCPHSWLNFGTEVHCLDDLEVVLRSERHDAISLRLAERHIATEPLDGRRFFLAEARSPGLAARLEGITNLVPGTGLAVRAAGESGGHVRLTWTLRPWRENGYGEWSATVTTSMAAGEEKDALAAGLREFLTREGTR